jgi:hypothetical protein
MEPRRRRPRRPEPHPLLAPTASTPPQALLMPRLVFLAAQSEGSHFSLSDLDRRMGSIYL